jgi:uncharacterized 2Fe-2S/4Fe-4S cluster protein (DUF4445 family)
MADPPEALAGPTRDGYHLACKAVVQSDCELSLSGGPGGEWQGAAASGDVAVSPDEAHIRLEELVVEPPSLQDQRSDQDRIGEALGALGVEEAPPVRVDLAEVGDRLRAAGWRIPVLLEGRTCLCPFDRDRFLGFAVDLGTTTVDVALHDLRTGQRIGRRTLFNKQAAYGADVISRAQAYRADPDAVRRAALTSVSEAAHTILEDNGIDPVQVVRTVVVGNPIMLHILHGVDPHPLTVAPYVTRFSGMFRRSPAEMEWRFQRLGAVESLPLVSAYVGADTTAVILSLALLETEETVLAVDVGTNGEIVLARGGQLYATSAAAGPAFEGAQISCGSRATPGAVSRVAVEPSGVSLEVIGGGAPRSICGTALTMAIAAMLDAEVLDETGRLAEPADVPEPLRSRLFEVDGQPSFALSDDRRVYITQKDVRELQLAKGAIRTAIESLLAETETPWSEVNRVHLAGNFGAGMSVTAEMRIGMLPAASLDRVDSVGNAALRGAALALVSSTQRQAAERVGSRCRFLELAGRPDFQMRFAEAMMF